MARTLTAGMVTEVTAESLRPILLCKLAFDSGDLNLWTGIGDLSFAGDTYTGAGDILNFTPVQESESLIAHGLTGSLSGIPSAIIAIALDEDYMGRAADLWFGALTAASALVADPVKVFGGLMDVMTIEDAGETATVTISAENRLARLEKPRVRRYTPDDQAIDYVGDKGLDFVTALNDGREIVWGRR